MLVGETQTADIHTERTNSLILFLSLSLSRRKWLHFGHWWRRRTECVRCASNLSGNVFFSSLPLLRWVCECVSCHWPRAATFHAIHTQQRTKVHRSDLENLLSTQIRLYIQKLFYNTLVDGCAHKHTHTIALLSSARRIVACRLLEEMCSDVPYFNKYGRRKKLAERCIKSLVVPIVNQIFTFGVTNVLTTFHVAIFDWEPN